MRRFGIVLAATYCVMLLPKPASATIYSFQATESSALSPSPVSFSFSLDTATASRTANGADFSDVTLTENGVSTTSNSVGASFTTDLSSPLFFWVDTSATPFYAGSGTGIAFNTGSFAIADGATDGEGTLLISSAAMSPAPEPATWALLLSGAVFALVLSRHRRSENQGLGRLQ